MLFKPTNIIVIIIFDKIFFFQTKKKGEHYLILIVLNIFIYDCFVRSPLKKKIY